MINYLIHRKGDNNCCYELISYKLKLKLQFILHLANGYNFIISYKYVHIVLDN